MVERVRILIVDDDESLRKTLKVILRAEGWHVDTAENGKQAVEKTNRNFYNVALIDICLPDMNGTELLAKMKETTPKMRKIIITGNPSLQNAVEALNSEANVYLQKPFDIKKAIGTIREQLSKQEAEKKFSQDKVVEFIETRVKEIVPQKSETTRETPKD